MFERYALFEIDKLRDRFALTAGVPKGVKASYNISPVQLAPVILIRDGARVMERMKWGFVRSNAKDTNAVFRYKTFIAKSEDALSKPTWETAVRTRRCLVPVDGFYEWKMEDGKQPYFIRPKAKGSFALAGIYSSWTDPSGTEFGTFAIITCSANKEMSNIGSRMPVILHREDEATWLDPNVSDANTLYDLMRPYYDSSVLEVRRVGQDVLNAKIDRPELIR